MSNIINPPTPEDAAALMEFFAAHQANQREHKLAAIQASRELDKIIATFPQQTGQSFKLRSLLYSLWNGQPADLSDVLCLDWPLRKALCHVILGFGFESRSLGEINFFYAAVQSRLEKAGLFEWFLEAHIEKKP